MDSADGERWMTYAEIADMRGCSRAAAERWTQRQKLRRQPGNDGKTRVLVAPALVEQSHPRKEPRTDPDVTPALAAFEHALTAIREAHASEVAGLREAHAEETSTLREQLADASARAEATSQRADKAEAALSAERARGDALRDRLDEAEAELRAAVAAATRAITNAQAAQDAAEALRQADDARKARGRWARLKAAWRGE